jgi:predicted transcriptional regulator
MVPSEGVMKNMHPLIEIYNNYGQKDEAVVSNELVCKIFSRISNTPGRTSASIAKTLGIDPKTVEWHLKKLIDANVVVQNSQKNKYWLKGVLNENELIYMDALSSDASAIIVNQLIEKGRLSLNGLEDVNRNTAHRKIKLLENVGLVSETKSGREIFVHLNEKFFVFKEKLRTRMNIFTVTYLRRLKLSKVGFEIIGMSEFDLTIMTDYGFPIILSRDPVFTVLKYAK